MKMRTKIHYLLVFVVAAIVCVPALAEVEALETGSKPLLIGRSNPALAGIEKIHVVIIPSSSEPNQDGLVWRELESKVINKLNKSGIKILPGIAGNILDIDELRVCIDMVRLDDSQQYVFHIQTSAARKVALPTKFQRYIKTDVWKTPPVMLAVLIENMPAKVTDVILGQAEGFIHAYLAANLSVKNRPNAGPAGPAGPVLKPSVSAYKYVASKNSNIFHRPDCSSARRIKHDNMIIYNTRAEAIKAGKRPCKRCKP